MRVIAGSAKLRRLEPIKGQNIRPTSDRVKEAIFTIIQFDIAGKRVLDLFAGTGQLGIEALSRGASDAVFVDNSPTSIETVRKNLLLTSLKTKSQVYKTSYDAYLKTCSGKFDIAFLDPPYNKNILPPALNAVAECMNPGSLIICEHSDKDILPPKVGDFESMRTYKYGTVRITLYRN